MKEALKTLREMNTVQNATAGKQLKSLLTNLYKDLVINSY